MGVAGRAPRSAAAIRAAPTSDVSTLPVEVQGLVQDAYGNATAELFLIATPLAALVLVVVLFLQEKPLKTTTAAQRLEEERAS